jgi:hypothetical protein
MAKTVEEKKKELEAKKDAIRQRLINEMKKIKEQERKISNSEKATLRKERNHGMYIAMGELIAEWKKNKDVSALNKIMQSVPEEKKKFIKILIDEIKG